MNISFQQIQTALGYLMIPFLISLIGVPVTKFLGDKLDIVAHENKRTVHHGRIVRIGGMAIYAAFMLAMAYFMHADQTINAILIGGAIIFMGGLIDDMLELRPRYKLMFEFAAAIVAIAYGKIYLGDINILFLHIHSTVLSMLVSFVWIVGVTNAINLIDGLDGLSSGICIIVLTTIGFIAQQMQLIYVSKICLILMGSIAGFLVFNFHPASIFMGDCGALFLGYTISCLSLLGFKTTTFITLGFPVVILFVPISDTLVAMARRKLSGHGMMEADKSHMHHVLMLKMGLSHRNTVLVMYLTAALFGMAAVVSYFNQCYGILMVIVLVIIYDIFVEYTGMLNPKYRPLLTIFEKISGKKIERK